MPPSGGKPESGGGAAAKPLEDAIRRIDEYLDKPDDKKDADRRVVDEKDDKDNQEAVRRIVEGLDTSGNADDKKLARRLEDMNKDPDLAKRLAEAKKEGGQPAVRKLVEEIEAENKGKLKDLAKAVRNEDPDFPDLADRMDKIAEHPRAPLDAAKRLADAREKDKKEGTGTQALTKALEAIEAEIKVAETQEKLVDMATGLKEDKDLQDLAPRVEKIVKSDKVPQDAFDRLEKARKEGKDKFKQVLETIEAETQAAENKKKLTTMATDLGKNEDLKGLVPRIAEIAKSDKAPKDAFERLEKAAKDGKVALEKALSDIEKEINAAEAPEDDAE